MNDVTTQTILVGGGIIFIFFGVVGYIILPKIGMGPQLTKWTRISLGIAGISFLAIGILYSPPPPVVVAPPLTSTPSPVPTGSPTPTPLPSPTPSPSPSPTPPPEAKITSPKEGDEVPVSTIVSGTFSGELPEGQYMWVVINPHPSPGQWWPQGGRINPWKGEWNVQVWLGREKEDIGKEFDIAVIFVNEKDDQYYRDYLKTGQETRSYPGIPLPTSANIIDKITVMRK